MISSKMNTGRVLARAIAQIEGMKSRPELAVALPVTADDITAAIAKVGESRSRAESLRKAWQAATRVTREAAFELSRKLELNIVTAEMSHGVKSDEVIALGAKVLLHKPKSVSPEQQTGSSPDAGEGAAKIA